MSPGKLGYLLFVRGLALGGAGWALRLYVTDRGAEALLTVLVTMGVTRLLARGWYYRSSDRGELGWGREPSIATVALSCRDPLTRATIAEAPAGDVRSDARGHASWREAVESLDIMPGMSREWSAASPTHGVDEHLAQSRGETACSGGAQWPAR